MDANSGLGSGNNSSVYFDDGAFQEVTFQTIGGTAESQISGVVVNMIPKDGGNAFKGTGFATYANDKLLYLELQRRPARCRAAGAARHESVVGLRPEPRRSGEAESRLVLLVGAVLGNRPDGAADLQPARRAAAGAVRLHQSARELPGAADDADRPEEQAVGVLQLDAAQPSVHQHLVGPQHGGQLCAERHDVGADDHPVRRPGEMDRHVDQSHAGGGRLLDQPLHVRDAVPGFHHSRRDQEGRHHPEHAVERRRRRHDLSSPSCRT